MEPIIYSHAWYEGLANYDDTIDDGDNPYIEGTQEYVDWEAGYEQGRVDW